MTKEFNFKQGSAAFIYIIFFPLFSKAFDFVGDFKIIRHKSNFKYIKH